MQLKLYPKKRNFAYGYLPNISRLQVVQILQIKEEIGICGLLVEREYQKCEIKKY